MGDWSSLRMRCRGFEEARGRDDADRRVESE
jgi:hypothetical protein